MQSALKHEFNKTAAAAYEAFPGKLERLVVLVVPTEDTPVYVSPAVAEELSRNVGDVKKFIAGLSADMQRRGWAGLANRYESIAQTSINMVALNEIFLQNFYHGREREMWSFLVLDHELGHHVTEKGMSMMLHRSVCECSAEAYAALRHIQRFGKGTPFLSAEMNRVAYSIVLRADSTHYTSETIARAMQVAEDMDISGLSLPETAVLAQKIADETTMGEGVLEKIRCAYKPVQYAYFYRIGDFSTVVGKLYARDPDAYALFCRETLAVMRGWASDADVFKAGKRFLSYPPIAAFMQEQAKTDAFYKDALDFLKKAQNRGTGVPARPFKKSF